MRFSIITPMIRGVNYASQVRQCIKNQTYTDYEHIVVFDGPPPQDIIDFFKEECKKYPNCFFYNTPIHEGDCGTVPRNFGMEKAVGDFYVFLDDDDVCTKNYLQTFIDLGISGHTHILGICKMRWGGCDIPYNITNFPKHCEVGTPNCAFPNQWFKPPYNIRWVSAHRNNYAHDFILIRECVNRFKPELRLSPNVNIIVKGQLESVS